VLLHLAPSLALLFFLVRDAPWSHIAEQAGIVIHNPDLHTLILDSLYMGALQAPKNSDFDRIVDMVQTAPDSSAFVFNCQMGRGRTTTGMIIASLALLQRAGALGDALTHSLAADGHVAPMWFASGIQRALDSQVQLPEQDQRREACR
jgi:hypothetical protein